MDVVYVDASDNVIGSGSKQDAIDKGIAVRIARIFLFNSNEEMLIQKRSDTVKSLPGRWDQTAAGHVDEGETYSSAATRELKEEMGIEDVRLTRVIKFYTEETDEEKVKKRFNVVYSGLYEGEVNIDNHEVSDFKWLSVNSLQREMDENPDSFTEGFIEAFHKYMETSESSSS